MSDLVYKSYAEIHPITTELQLDRERARANVAEYARAKETLRAYKHDWKVFQAWCELRRVRSLPASHVDVCAHLAHLEGRGLALSTIERAYCAIALFHRNANAPGWQPPRGFPPSVKLELDAIRRKLGSAQHGKNPIVVRDLARLVGAIEGEELARVRDRAMLLLGFWMASRRSEIVALDVADVQVLPEGVKMHLKRSKTDQEGKGDDKAAPRTEDPALCPALALDRWLRDSAITEGPLFRAIDRWGHMSPSRLEVKAYVRAIKRYASAAGFDASQLSGHSLRSGFVTTAAKEGKSVDAIMRQTLHKDPGTVLGYIKMADLFKNNAASGLGLRRPRATDTSGELTAWAVQIIRGAKSPRFSAESDLSELAQPSRALHRGNPRVDQETVGPRET